jgi:hypothetical protein
VRAERRRQKRAAQRGQAKPMTSASWPRGTSAGALACVRVAWCSGTQAERLRTTARAGRTAARRGEGRQRRRTTRRGCCLANRRSRSEKSLPSDGLVACVCARLAAKQGPGQHGGKQGKRNSTAKVSHANGARRAVRFNKGDANATAHVGSRPSCARVSARAYQWLGHGGELHGGMPGRTPDWGGRPDMP